MTELIEEREALAARLTALKIEEIASRNQVRKFSIAHQIVFPTQNNLRCGRNSWETDGKIRFSNPTSENQPITEGRCTDEEIIIRFTPSALVRSNRTRLNKPQPKL
jgi:hypothetical protein